MKTPVIFEEGFNSNKRNYINKKVNRWGANKFLICLIKTSTYNTPMNLSRTFLSLISPLIISKKISLSNHYHNNISSKLDSVTEAYFIK